MWILIYIIRLFFTSFPATGVDWSSPTALPIGSAITPIKDQGQCGSCWAFASVGAIEGAYAIKHGQLKSFSEQQMVSCDKAEGGCNGGWPSAAMLWVGTVGGLSLEADYPYTASGSVCKTSAAKDIKTKTTAVWKLFEYMLYGSVYFCGVRIES